MLKRLCLTFACFMVVGFMAEAALMATTEDGRKVVLNADKTWDYMNLPQNEDWTKIVQFVDFQAEHITGSIDSGSLFNSVRVYFQFKNISEKTITGVAYKVRFKDGFGDVVYSTTLKDDLLLRPDELNPMDEYWNFEEELFSDSPYARLQSAARPKLLFRMG